jgi:phospholipid transport system substrate-binding protein
MGLAIVVSTTRGERTAEFREGQERWECRPHEKLPETAVATLSRVVMSRQTASAAALALVLTGEAWAGPPTETLRDAFAAVNRLLEDPELQERPTELLSAVRSVVNDSLHLREAARQALGREWEVLTPAEQREFIRLFADLLRPAYFSALASRARVRGGLAVRYHDEVIEGHRATVRATLVARDGGELPVEFRLIRDRDHWSVYDAVIGGVSLVANYRAQFSRVIRQSSYPELVLVVKAKTSEAPSALSAPKRAVLAARTAAAARPPDVDRDRAGRDAPEPAASPPQAPAPPPAYWLQLGAFKDANTARRLVARLLARDLPVTIDSVAAPAGRPGRLLARVRVGPFADEAEAVAKLQKLRTLGYRPLLARGSDRGR